MRASTNHQPLVKNAESCIPRPTDPSSPLSVRSSTGAAIKALLEGVFNRAPVGRSSEENRPAGGPL
jgi:hypothetical protein